MKGAHESSSSATMGSIRYTPVTTPPLWQLFTADDAVWFLWIALIVGPICCGIALCFIWHVLLWKAIGVMLSLAAALLFATHLAPRPQTDLSNEIVLITGGSTGVGLELGQQLVKRGAKVVVLSLQLPKESLDGITAYACDVSDRDAVRRAANVVRKEVGEPTVVVNNAGVVQGKLLLDLTEANVRNTFGVNTMAPFWVTQEFLPAMLRKRRGHIVNMSSVMGLVACAQLTDYTASKAAVVAFHASLRNELDYRYDTPEIRTTLVLPGHITTRLFERTVTPKSGFMGHIAPSLSPSVVASAVVRAIEGGKASTVLRLPWFTQSGRLLNPASELVPGPLLKLSSWLSGADWAMSDYGPHPDAGQRLAEQRATEAKAGGSPSSL